MNALILVGLQNDFLPGGAMAVPQGDAVIPLANQLQGAFKFVVATQDWHPANHKSFANNHPGRKPGELIKLKKSLQTLWPAHCIQNTRGAEFAPGLRLNRFNKVFKKGMDAEVDSYSAFFDYGHEHPTGLHEYLHEKKITHVYLMGLATDFSVKFSTLDSVSLGFRTFLIEDACRGVNLNSGDDQNAIEEMERAGVTRISSRQLAELVP